MTETSTIIIASSTATATLLAAVHQIACFERALAHVLAGWTAKLPEYVQKTDAAQIVHRALTTAQALDRSLAAFEAATTLHHAAPEAWRAAMESIDRSPDAAALAEAIVLDLQPRLADRYRVALGLVDELLHASLHAALLEGMHGFEARERRLLGWLAASPQVGRRDLLADAWRSSEAASAPIVWAPIDRVARPARPQGTKTMPEGALRPLPRDGLRISDAAGIGLILHNNVNGEYTTMELMLRCLYEHPDMPAAFHADLGRHASDEARHALALERMAMRFGTRYGDHPVFVSTYELNYAFEPCRAGSREELLWRLLLRATVQEGESLDDLAFQARRRTHLGQHDLAEMFAAILADEIFHVRSGLRWSRHLCGELGRDEVVEREAANEYYNNRMLLRRAQFVRSNPDAAAAERAVVAERVAYQRSEGVTVPFDMTVNAPTREFAGFSARDIAQARRWEEARR